MVYQQIFVAGLMYGMLLLASVMIIYTSIRMHVRPLYYVPLVVLIFVYSIVFDFYVMTNSSIAYKISLLVITVLSIVSVITFASKHQTLSEISKLSIGIAIIIIANILFIQYVPFQYHGIMVRGSLTIIGFGLLIDFVNKTQSVLFKAHQHADSLFAASVVQQNSLPASQPSWDKLDVACITVPADTIGGDFYTYLRIKTKLFDRYFIAIGDVSGKGLEAGLMATAGLLLYESQCGLNPSNLLGMLDSLLIRSTRTTGLNIALVHVELSFEEDGTITLKGANAGCIAPYIIKPLGKTEWLELMGMPLGMGGSNFFAYKEEIRKISKGYTIILISDGVIEANNKNGAFFGFDKFKSLLSVIPPGLTAGETRDFLLSHVYQFTDEASQYDDFTIIVIKV